MPRNFTRTIELRRRLPILNRAGIAALRFDGHRGDSPPHGHDVVEAGLVLRGEGRHVLDEVETPVRPGSLVIVGYGQVHRYLTSAAGLDIINVFLDPEAVPPPTIDVGPATAVAPLIPLHPGLVHRQNRVSHLRVDSEVRLAVEGVARETARSETASVTVLRAWYRLFLTACVRCLGPVVPVGSAMEDLRRFLDDHATGDHSLPDLARRWRMTVPSLCRSFKHHTGRTVIGYLHQRRIEQALHRLVATDDKVTAIALAVGFADLSHFHRIFRRIVGTSPGRWRFLHRGATSLRGDR